MPSASSLERRTPLTLNVWNAGEHDRTGGIRLEHDSAHVGADTSVDRSRSGVSAAVWEGRGVCGDCEVDYGVSVYEW